MAADASAADIDHLVSVVQEAGGEAFVSRGRAAAIIGLSGDTLTPAPTLTPHP
jgi:3-deoxy-7-phosphoheptulonate synthase